MKRADLATVLNRLLPRIWTFALRLVGDASFAEALVARSYRAALDRKHDAPADKDISLWFFAIFCSVWQRDFRVCDKGSSTELPASTQTEAKAKRSREHHMVIDAVASLPDLQRFAMLLVTVEGIGFENASEILGLSVDATVRLLSQARLAIGTYFHRLDKPD
jgi:RNA polymerase sigma-70 factor (ECF subfamily)